MRSNRVLPTAVGRFILLGLNVVLISGTPAVRQLRLNEYVTLCCVSSVAADRVDRFNRFCSVHSRGLFSDDDAAAEKRSRDVDVGSPASRRPDSGRNSAERRSEPGDGNRRRVDRACRRRRRRRGRDFRFRFSGGRGNCWPRPTTSGRRGRAGRAASGRVG